MAKKKLSLMLLMIPAVLSATPASTTSTISFSGNPVAVGDDVTVTANVTVATAGTMKLEQLVDGTTLLPTSCGTPGATYLEMISVGLPATASAKAYTSIGGSFGYRAHYVPGGGGGGSFHESMSPCTNLVVSQPAGCTGGLLIAAMQSSGTDLPVAGTTWTGSFTIRVSNCSLNIAPGVKSQGGTSAWTTVQSMSADVNTSVGVRKATGGGNQVLLWTIGDMAAQQVDNLVVNLSGKIKAGTASGTVLNINGGWSASATAIPTTSYTDPLTITVF